MGRFSGMLAERIGLNSFSPLRNTPGMVAVNVEQ